MKDKALLINMIFFKDRQFFFNGDDSKMSSNPVNMSK